MAARDIVGEAAVSSGTNSAARSDRRRRHHQALMWREIRRLAGSGEAVGRSSRPAAPLRAQQPAEGTGSP